MEIIEKSIEVNDYLTKSNLPASDYVINPYVGCSHGCRYCHILNKIFKSEIFNNILLRRRRQNNVSCC